jgi:hypothetical protein
MNALKCASCGFVGFPEDGSCKRCGQSVVSQMPARTHHVNDSAEQNFRRFLKITAVLMVLVGIVIGVVIVRSKLKPDPKLAYIEAIKKSPQFTEPVTVRVNQKPIPGNLLLGGFAATKRNVYIIKSAYVLESLGLLTISKETSYHESESEFFTWETKSERWVIFLTEKGHEESVNWWTSEEPYFGQNNKVSWWRIPIGQREFIRIESVTQPREDIVYLNVRWRWRPNTMGEYFDCGGSLVGSLPQAAQEGARSLEWNSQTEYSAQASLRKVGNGWEVQYLSFDSDNIARPNLPGFLPL